MALETTKVRWVRTNSLRSSSDIEAARSGVKWRKLSIASRDTVIARSLPSIHMSTSVLVPLVRTESFSIPSSPFPIFF